MILLRRRRDRSTSERHTKFFLERALDRRCQLNSLRGTCARSCDTIVARQLACSAAAEQNGTIGGESLFCALLCLCFLSLVLLFFLDGSLSLQSFPLFGVGQSCKRLSLLCVSFFFCAFAFGMFPLWVSLSSGLLSLLCVSALFLC